MTELDLLLDRNEGRAGVKFTALLRLAIHDYGLNNYQRGLIDGLDTIGVTVNEIRAAAIGSRDDGICAFQQHNAVPFTRRTAG